MSSLLREKISAEQFIADVIQNSISVYEKNIHRIIGLCDESNILKDTDKEYLKRNIDILIIVGTIINTVIYFKKHISAENAAEFITILYGKYLKEYKKYDDKYINDKLLIIGKILDGFENIDESRLSKIKNEDDKLRFICCKSFSNMYAGSDLKNQYTEYKNLVAFKLAKNVLRNSLIGHMLKKYKIIWPK